MKSKICCSDGLPIYSTFQCPRVHFVTAESVNNAGYGSHKRGLVRTITVFGLQGVACQNENDVQ